MPKVMVSSVESQLAVPRPTLFPSSGQGHFSSKAFSSPESGNFQSLSDLTGV